MLASRLGLALFYVPFAFAATYNVSVGANGLLRYDPQYVNAAVGDVVYFIL
jgi:plastocyanin